MKIFPSLAILSVILLLNFTAFSQVEYKKLAYIVGNTEYEELNRMPYAEKYAFQLAEKLEGQGFTVIYHSNLTGDEMKEGAKKLKEEVALTNPDVVVKYFAGHKVWDTSRKGTYFLGVDYKTREKNKCKNCVRIGDTATPSAKLQLNIHDACCSTTGGELSMYNGLQRNRLSSHSTDYANYTFFPTPQHTDVSVIFNEELLRLLDRGLTISELMEQWTESIESQVTLEQADYASFLRIFDYPEMRDFRFGELDQATVLMPNEVQIETSTTVSAGLVGADIGDQKRVALVIGNSDYLKGAKLKNPVNDANAMARTLSSIGFKVSVYTDLDHRAMMEAIQSYNAELSSADVSLFYYAGHGIQVDNKNYLLPIDAEFNNGKSDVQFESINVEMITRAFDMTNDNSLNVVVLDACRNNPFRSWSRGGESGLAEVRPPSGTLVAFSTSPGAVASDGDGENGVYTGELIKQLLVPQRIEDVFINTRNSVESLTDGEQSPWELARLRGAYYLLPENEK